mmetsp:Transcript_9379/g.24260  ORF Transcript_9379/g.24260 Transcript_9379/m.24260 type:complete len:301 (+) Transcript_9379:131-1033(+)
MFGRSVSGQYGSRVTLCVVLCIYAGEWCIYHVVCKPVIGWALLFNAVLALAVWSYLQTACTDPGTCASPEWQEWATLRAQQATPGQVANGSADNSERSRRSRRPTTWSPGEVTWCPECSQERPERAHHCSQCGLCVLRMDHHCPWVGSCIGWRNHKHFLLLNWWSFWASFVWLGTLRNPSALQALEVLSGVILRPPSLLPLLGAASAFAFLLITGGMFFYSLSMVCRNQTSVDQLYFGENPYMMPSSLDNVRQLLGPIDWRLLLPLEPSQEGRPTGTIYPVLPKEGDAETGNEKQGYGTC